MRIMLQDLRYACRALASKPGLTAIIMVTLALGIGANTAVFSVINTVMLRPLAYDRPDDLAMVWETNQKMDNDRFLVSYPNFEDWKQQNDVFENIGVLCSSSFTLTGVDIPRRVRGAAVSSGFFAALRINAALGRTFRPEEDRPGAPRVVVLSDGFWRRHCGADPDLPGQRLALNGNEYEVIGVLPPDFDFPVQIGGAELWTPTGLLREIWFESRGGHGFRTIARLKPGVSLPQAQAEMDTIAARLEQQYPDSNAGSRIQLHWMARRCRLQRRSDHHVRRSLLYRRVRAAVLLPQRHQ